MAIEIDPETGEEIDAPEGADVEATDTNPEAYTPTVTAPEQVALPAPAPVVAPGARRVVAPGPTGPYQPAPGYDPEMVQNQIQNSRLLASMGQAPIAEAEAAVATAMKFQAIRGYQRDIANGVAAEKAMAKWGPSMFAAPKAGTLGQAASFIRATRPPLDKLATANGTLFRYDPATKSAVALTAPKAATTPVPHWNPYDLNAHRQLLADITAAERAIDNPNTDLDTVKNLQEVKLPALRAEERRMRAAAQPVGTAPRGVIAPRTGPPGSVRVKNPQGKYGYIPQSKLEAALAAGYTRP